MITFRINKCFGMPSPVLANRTRALLQKNNAHRAKITKHQLEEFEGLEVLPYPAYSPKLAPINYHLFLATAHFLLGQGFNNKWMRWSGDDFFSSKPVEW